MSQHFDELETRDPAAREEALFARLPAFLAKAAARAPGLARSRFPSFDEIREKSNATR